MTEISFRFVLFTEAKAKERKKAKIERERDRERKKTNMSKRKRDEKVSRVSILIARDIKHYAIWIYVVKIWFL